MRYSSKQEVIDAITSGELTMSYSSIKEFSKSPSHFIRYKIGEKRQTDAMRFGTLVHTVILEPHKLKDEYCVFTKPLPNNNMNKTENKEAWAKLQLLAEEQNKTVVKEEDIQLAKAISEIVRSNEPSEVVLNGCFDFEKRVSWTLEGFTWNGMLDGVGVNHQVDLKKTRDAGPEKIKWNAVREKWHWQAYLYAMATNPFNPLSVDHFNLCVSESDFGVSVNKIGWNLMALAKSEIKETMEQFRQCYLDDRWDDNYNFWSKDNGVFTID